MILIQKSQVVLEDLINLATGYGSNQEPEFIVDERRVERDVAMDLVAEGKTVFVPSTTFFNAGKITTKCAWYENVHCARVWELFWGTPPKELDHGAESARALEILEQMLKKFSAVKICGYAASFHLPDGFEKSQYWEEGPSGRHKPGSPQKVILESLLQKKEGTWAFHSSLFGWVETKEQAQEALSKKL